MRTALFFVALAIRDVAEALGAESLSVNVESMKFITLLVFIAMAMDVVDFVRGKK